jgi:two-component system, cell cycle sensor histidine kinase and response regulator CckA
LNLVLNARDAAPERGCIHIETRNAGFHPIDYRTSTPTSPCLPCVLVSVTDNGRGMDAETRRHLFEPFFSTKAEKGSGLGLATVQSIVSSHRGLIHFESQPGLGTCAMILFPRAESGEIHSSSVPRVRAQIASELPSQHVNKESRL